MKKIVRFDAVAVCIVVVILLAVNCKKESGGAQFVNPVVNPPITEFAKTGFKSLDYLYSISGKKTVAGQEARQYWQPMYDVSGKYPALWGEDLSFFPFGGTSTMSEWRTLITNEAKQRWAEGALISIMFHACPPTQPEPCDWNTGIKSKLTDNQWSELITDGTSLNNNWKARLDIIAPYLLELKQNGVEVLFRPFHEMNQSAFWWGGRPGANGTRKLYQLTHDYLVKTKSLTNLIWVWNIQDFSSLANDVNIYDPGSEYWDMLTLDVYASDGAGYTVNKYNTIVQKAAGKPIAIGECGKLPALAILASQPKWTFFMGWAELTQQQNTNNEISVLYKSTNVITLDKMPRW